MAHRRPAAATRADPGAAAAGHRHDYPATRKGRNLMSRILALVVLAALAPAAHSQPNPLLPAKEASALFRRSVQLIESTSATVPGLVRAAAPSLENARQALINIESGTPGNT